jgi:hypothetical protein
MRTTLVQKQKRELAKLREAADKLKGQQCSHCIEYSLFYFIKADDDGHFELPLPSSWRLDEDDEPPDSLCFARCPRCSTYFRVAVLRLYRDDEDDNAAGLRNSDVVADLLQQEEKAEASGQKIIQSNRP